MCIRDRLISCLSVDLTKNSPCLSLILHTFLFDPLYVFVSLKILFLFCPHIFHNSFQLSLCCLFFYSSFHSLCFISYLHILGPCLFSSIFQPPSHQYCFPLYCLLHFFNTPPLVSFPRSSYPSFTQGLLCCPFYFSCFSPYLSDSF